VVFSKIGGMFRKDDGGGESPEAVRAFESQHLVADRVGPILCVTVLCEAVSDREAHILYNETDGAIDDRCSNILVDLSKVGVLTSAGIGALVRLHKRIEERKGKLAVCALNPELAELFRLTRMDRLFVMAENRERALQDLRR
jgi:anti-anti-sigma factor